MEMGLIPKDLRDFNGLAFTDTSNYCANEPQLPPVLTESIKKNAAALKGVSYDIY